MQGRRRSDLSVAEEDWHQSLLPDLGYLNSR